MPSLPPPVNPRSDRVGERRPLSSLPNPALKEAERVQRLQRLAGSLVVLCDQIDVPFDQARALLRTAASQIAAGDQSELRLIFGRAEALGRQLSGQEKEEFLIESAALYAGNCQFFAAQDAVDRMEPGVRRAAVLIDLAAQQRAAGHPFHARENFTRGAAEATAGGAMLLVATACAGLKQREQALAAFDKALEQAERQAGERGGTPLYPNVIARMCELGFLEEALAKAAALQSPGRRCQCLLKVATAQFEVQRLRECAGTVKRALKAGWRVEQIDLALPMIAQGGALQYQMGKRWSAAKTFHQAAQAAYWQPKGRPAAGSLLLQIAEAAAVCGYESAARRSVQSAMTYEDALEPQTIVKRLSSIAARLYGHGALASAAEIYECAWKIFPDVGNGPAYLNALLSLSICEAGHARVDAELERVRGAAGGDRSGERLATLARIELNMKRVDRALEAAGKIEDGGLHDETLQEVVSYQIKAKEYDAAFETALRCRNPLQRVTACADAVIAAAGERMARLACRSFSQG